MNETKPKLESDYKVTAFSCPKSLLVKARARARGTKRSLSGHIQQLLAEDLAKARHDKQTA